MSKTAPQENPLVSNKKLRQLYTAMVEARILDDHAEKLRLRYKKAKRVERRRGQEACLVSTSIELESGDLVSDIQQGAMDLTSDPRSSRGHVIENWISLGHNQQTSWTNDSDEWLHIALGAALAFKKLKQANLLLVYIQRDDAGGGSWKRVLTLAARLELPIIFVVLPNIEKGKKSAAVGRVSAKAGVYGVPGIPVDSSDAVALYRVAQESIGRIRGGGGPVVIECLATQTQKGFADPIVQMKKFLLEKKVCTPAWLDNAGDAIRARIAKAAKQ